jgi:hypothetical protein
VSLIENRAIIEEIGIKLDLRLESGIILILWRFGDFGQPTGLFLVN